MFRKVLFFAMFAAAAGGCFASDDLQQVVTSEVFYDENYVPEDMAYAEQEQVVFNKVPAWPLVGSEADVEVGFKGNPKIKRQDDNIRIVSKVGEDLIIENNFNIGARGEFTGWSGGANMLHGNQIPVGFDDECLSGTEMPLLHREVLEDDGGSVLAVSRSGRKVCGRAADEYNAFAVKNNMKQSVVGGADVKKAVLDNGNAVVSSDGKSITVSMPDGNIVISADGVVTATGASRVAQKGGDVVAVTGGSNAVARGDNAAPVLGVDEDIVATAGGDVVATSGDGSVVVSVADDGKVVVTSYESELIVDSGEFVEVNGNAEVLDAMPMDTFYADNSLVNIEEETEIAVDVSADAEAPIVLKDQVRSWVVVNGQTLRQVLQSWADKEGWDLVWTTSREYPIEASAVFKGRFVDVASALVRNFGRATPVPYAKFYKGNRVLVISTVDE